MALKHQSIPLFRGAHLFISTAPCRNILNDADRADDLSLLVSIRSVTPAHPSDIAGFLIS